MSWHHRIFTTTLALISLVGEIGHSSPAAAASLYPLWICGGRYGGWGWSRPAVPLNRLTLDNLAGALANPYGYQYVYPAPRYVFFVYPNPYCQVSY